MMSHRKYDTCIEACHECMDECGGGDGRRASFGGGIAPAGHNVIIADGAAIEFKMEPKKANPLRRRPSATGDSPRSRARKTQQPPKRHDTIMDERTPHTRYAG